MPQFLHIQLLSSAIELIINQALSMGNHSASMVTQLNSKSLAIELSELKAVLCLTANEQKILVTSPADKNASFDCKVSTSLQTLVQLKTEQELTQLIKNDQLNITGDIKIAQQYAGLFESLAIDWPSELEKHIGDIATHKLLQLAKQVGKKVKFAQQQIESDAGEYLVHEKKWVATKLDIDQFSHQVSAIADDFSSLEEHYSILAIKLEQFSQRLQKEG